jgi:DNA polymerase-1
MFQAENREFFEWLKKQLGGTLHFRYKRGEIPKPPEGLIKYCLVQLDFMSAEIRWWAIISQCPELAKGFIQGKAYRDAYRADPTNKEKSKLAKLAGDSHLNTAALMFQIAIDFVTKYQRQAAKNIAFGRIFKRTVEAIAEQLKNDNIAEVTALVNRFDKQFPRGNEWLNEIEQIAKTNLEVISPFGRKRRLVGYITEDRTICSENDRLARNQPIQGGSSDAAFFGASLMNDYILDNDKDWKIENSVHDSCLIECPIIELVEVLQVAEHMFTTETMKETARIWGIKYNVPLECEFEIGLNYGQLKKWDYSITQLAEIKQWLLEGAPAEDKKKN